MLWQQLVDYYSTDAGEIVLCMAGWIIGLCSGLNVRGWHHGERDG